MRFVITGSTQGIGRALATEAAKQAHQVLISGRTQAAVDAALDTIAAPFTQVVGQPADVADPVAVQALWDRATEAFGGVDVWINNAGLARTTWPILDLPQDQLEAMLDTNMRGTINGSRVAAKGMLAQGKGRIFNMLGGGSDGEYFPGMGVYGSTKRGLDYFSRALAKELKGTPVLVGRVRPGMIVTEGVKREIAADPANFAKSRKVMNILCDQPETVAPYLIQQMLAFEKSGSKIAWLSGAKMAKRFLLAKIQPRPDQFAGVDQQPQS